MIFARIASSLLFGLAANTDNFTIGIAYGIKHRWIRWPQNLLIAIVTTLITLGAMACGRQIRELLPFGMADSLGGVLLLTFAAWNIYRDRTGMPTPLSLRFSLARRSAADMSESLFLAGTLSINNVGLAVAGGIGGVTYISAGLTIFSFSVAMLALGQAVGSNFTEVRWVPPMLRHQMSGNAVLALAGALMLAGF